MEADEDAHVFLRELPHSKPIVIAITVSRERTMWPNKYVLHEHAKQARLQWGYTTRMGINIFGQAMLVVS